MALLLPVKTDSQYSFEYSTNIGQGSPCLRLIFALCLLLYLVTNLIDTILLFLIVSLFLSLVLCFSSSLVSLLVLYIYLGAYLVLFSYLWMYHTSSSPSAIFPLFVVTLLYLPIFSLQPTYSSLSSFRSGLGLILFFGCLLFFAILLVVYILDFSLGGFSG